MADAIGSVDNCLVREVLNDGHIKLLQVLKERYKGFEDVELSRVVVINNELTRCFEDYCNVS